MKDCVVISEFWPWGLAPAGYKATDYIELMKANGYIACEVNGKPIPVDKLNHICEVGQNDHYVVIDILFQKIV